MDSGSTNKFATSGLERCGCGCKYWENDRCVDCDRLNPRAAEPRLKSRLEILWNHALLHWPAKYRNALEAAMDEADDFNREAIRESCK